MDKLTELTRLPRNTEIWKLDRDIVIKAVEDVAKYETVVFRPEEYYDHKDLREAIDEALSDPNFGQFYRTQEGLREFRENHPDEAQLFESVDTFEAMEQLAAKYKDNPVYKEYLQLSEHDTSAALRLKVKMRSARVLPIAASYARLANFVFIETKKK